MSDEVKTLVEAEMSKVKNRFDGLESQRQEFIKKRSELDQQINEAFIEITRLQGEFRALENLQKAGGEPPTSGTETVH